MLHIALRCGVAGICAKSVMSYMCEILIKILFSFIIYSFFNYVSTYIFVNKLIKLNYENMFVHETRMILFTLPHKSGKSLIKYRVGE